MGWQDHADQKGTARTGALDVVLGVNVVQGISGVRAVLAAGALRSALF
jgi:hypothetical protein